MLPVFHFPAGKPKKDDAMKSLCLMLGPDFITEILEVLLCRVIALISVYFFLSLDM